MLRPWLLPVDEPLCVYKQFQCPPPVLAISDPWEWKLVCQAQSREYRGPTANKGLAVGRDTADGYGDSETGGDQPG